MSARRVARAGADAVALRRWSCALALVAVTRATLHHALALRASWPAEADTLYLPASTALRVASLGHTELAADLVAARTNVYFGTQIAAHGEQPLARALPQHRASISIRTFHRLYKRGATMLVYNGKDYLASTRCWPPTGSSSAARARSPATGRSGSSSGFNLLFELPSWPATTIARVPGVAPARRRGAAPGDAARRRAPAGCPTWRRAC